MRSARLLSACTLAATVVAASASAQTQAPPTQPPAPQKPAPAPAPAQPSAQTQSALKLAGLVTFVANSCPDLKPDYARFEVALGALGVSTTDLAKPDMRAAYLGYTTRYSSDVKANCARAKQQFGPGGLTLPDIFVPR